MLSMCGGMLLDVKGALVFWERKVGGKGWNGRRNWEGCTANLTALMMVVEEVLGVNVFSGILASSPTRWICGIRLSLLGYQGGCLRYLHVAVKVWF